METLTASQRWRKSGSTLSFKEWISRENEKEKAKQNDSFLPFVEDEKPVMKHFDDNSNALVQDTINNAVNQVINPQSYTTPVVTKENPNQVLGLDKKILIFSSLLLVGSLSFYFYKKLKNKK